MGCLRNAWYAVAWTEEIGRQLFGRTILGDPVVLFRNESNRLVAIGGRCPHRFAPLHRGSLIGDAVACPYHGLRFDASGQCVFNPHGRQHVPRAAHVPAYPVIERHLLVWIWMGAPNRADPDLIPDFSFVDRPGWVTVKGTILGRGHYELYSDNILDLGHAEFLHKNTVGAPSFTYGKRRMFQEANVVYSHFDAPNDYLSPVLSMIFQTQEKRVDAKVEVEWRPPASMLLMHYSNDVGAPMTEGQCLGTYHVFTPETDSTTYYFWVVSRIFRAEDQDLTKAIAEGFQATFESEDKPMISAQHDLMAGADFWSLKPVLLEGDAAGVRARRVLAKLIAEEQLQVDPSKANDAHAPTQIADDMTEGRPAADN
jgi:phenylpropionate dioxygenase-like ring-hydroxylating dioxygenase large terminal subunit